MQELADNKHFDTVRPTVRKILPYLNSPAITPLLLTRLTYMPSFISSENVKRASDDEPCTSLYLLVKSDSLLSAFQGTPVFAAKCSAVLRPCYSMQISISWRWLDRSNMAAQLTYIRTVNASSSFLCMSMLQTTYICHQRFNMAFMLES